MERNIQKNGLINFVILLLSAVAGLIVSRYSNLLAGEVACAFLGLGTLIAGVSWFQMRLEEQERLEKLEFDELNQAGGTSKLFNTQEAEAFPARRSRELFEKYFVRAFAVVLFLLQSLGAWWIWRSLESPQVTPLNQPLAAMALLGIFALVQFMIGQYSAGLARLENLRLLRPASNFLLLGSYLTALTAAGTIAVWAEFTKADLVLAMVFCVLMGLLAVETALSLLLEIYRPKIKGQVGLLLYESRLVGLLGHPEGIFTTAAQALDYQFGFKVSETWFYLFLKRALPAIVLVQLAILLLSTCVVFVEAGEEALLERFGKPVPSRNVLRPGLHLKLPWPLDKVMRYRTEEIQSFNVGFKHNEAAEEKTLLWTVAHYQEEFQLLVASRSQVPATNVVAGKKNPPVNLLSLGIPVQFQITNLTAWAYHFENSADLLEDIATREVVLYLASADMRELMSTIRFPSGEALRRKIQARADALNLGVKIVFVGLQDIHPPVAVARSYEDVVAARQDKEAEILSARAFATETNGLARSEAMRIKSLAEAQRQRLEVTALAGAELFTNKIPAFRTSPRVYAERSYLDTLSKGAVGARKIILTATNQQDVYELNLEEKIRSDLTDIPVPSAVKKKE